MSTLREIAIKDADALMEKDKEYGGSWKKRGGIGAYMMLARKWDRLEIQVEKVNWDIFESIRTDTRKEGVLDDIRDLRRYLLLVEQEMTKTSDHPAPFGYNAEEDK